MGRLRRRGEIALETGSRLFLAETMEIDGLGERTAWMLTERELGQLKEDIELLDVGGDEFTREKTEEHAGE